MLTFLSYAIGDYNLFHYMRNNRKIAILILSILAYGTCHEYAVSF